MRTTCPNIIRPSAQKELVMFRDGDTSDIITAILYQDGRSAEFVNMAQLDCLRGANDYETCRNIWHFTKKSIKYRADRTGHERVQSPGALMASRVGDCKSFSVLEGSLLRAFGIRFCYRFTSYSLFGDFSHVYVVATLADGQKVVMDAVHTKFDDEVSFVKHTDRCPKNQSSIGAIPATTSAALAAAAFLAGLWWVSNSTK